MYSKFYNEEADDANIYYSSLVTCLYSLRNGVFKLLPLRENYMNGDENHLKEYIENLCDSFDGAIDCYHDLAKRREIVDVRNNIHFMKKEFDDIPLERWKSITLGSTHLLQKLINKYRGIEHGRG